MKKKYEEKCHTGKAAGLFGHTLTDFLGLYFLAGLNLAFLPRSARLGEFFPLSDFPVCLGRKTNQIKSNKKITKTLDA